MSEFSGEMPVDTESKKKQGQKGVKKIKKLKRQNKKLKRSLKAKDKELCKIKGKLKTKDLIHGLERTCDQLKAENQLMKIALQSLAQPNAAAKELPESIINMEDEVT